MSRVRVRRAGGEDAAAIAGLSRAHAEYERSAANPGVADLAAALAGEPPRLLAWLAEDGGLPVGYATATVDFSTWRGRLFLYLDCLFLLDSHRGGGIGAELFRQAADHARKAGLREMEWQTPAWNSGAIRFYERLGSRWTDKARFILSW